MTPKSAEKPARFLRLKEVQHRTGLSKTTVYNLIITGDFPKPIKPTKRCSAWLEFEILAWQDRKVANRDNGLAVLGEPT